MSLSIMPLLILFASQFAAHPHHHQRQVSRPHQNHGGRQHVRVPLRAVLALRHLLHCLLAGSWPPMLQASHTTPPPPLSKLRQSTKLIRSLRLL